jgi:hypothetical protein
MFIGAIPYALLVFSYAVPLDGWDRLPLSLPFCILVGISASVLWTGQGIYFGRASVRNSMETGEAVEAVTSRLNGTFWSVFQLTGLSGLAIASLVQLSMGKDNFEKANQDLFMGLGVASGLGVLVFIALPAQPPMTKKEAAAEKRARDAPSSSPLELEKLGEAELRHRHGGDSAAVEPDEPDTPDTVGGPTLMSTLRLLYSSRQMQLMLPLIIYNGMSLGWFFTEFPLFYAPQTGRALMSHDMVGFVQGTFYFCNSIFCFVFGRLIQRYGRRVFVQFAALAAVVFYIIMLLLETATPLAPYEDGVANGGTVAMVFFMSIFFAVGDSVWESQIPAILMSTTFFESEEDRDAGQSSKSAGVPLPSSAPHELVCADLKMWQSFGFAIQLGLSVLVQSLVAKTVILTAMIVVAVSCVLYMDARVRPVDSPGPHKGGLRKDDDDSSERLLSSA